MKTITVAILIIAGIIIAILIIRLDSATTILAAQDKQYQKQTALVLHLAKRLSRCTGQPVLVKLDTTLGVTQHEYNTLLSTP